MVPLLDPAWRVQIQVLLVFVLLREISVRSVYSTPVFTLPSADPTSPWHKLYLDEDKKGNDVVAVLSAIDKDTDASKLVFTMDSSPTVTKNLFEINGRMLIVKSTVPAGTFDYEKDNAIRDYRIVLKVSDGKTLDNADTTINIRNVNEKPVFSGTNPLIVVVAESMPPGTTVYKVVAADPDATRSSITYAMSGASEFEIDSVTGEITVTSGTVFKKETTSQYFATITATESSPSQRLATAVTVRFNIAISPTFIPSTPTTATVNENAVMGTPVFMVNVVDGDTPNGNLSISIISQTPNSPTNMFELDNRVLKINKEAFDAEVQRTYAIVFQVTDRTFIVDSATLTVTVNDLNDNSPVITPVSPITIPETKPLGSSSVVVDVTATDADISSPNNALTYTILSGNTATTFGIVATTGVIYLLKAPLSSRYTLKVMVSDRATPPLFSEIDIIVNVDGTVLDECAVKPCQNGGSCTPSLNTFFCACATGYAGTSCKTNIDDCANTPCKNLGTCIDQVNSFRCNCAVGYKGTTCGEACSDNTYGSGCSQTCNCNASRLVGNVGTQTCNHKTGYCICNSKWTGPACETDVDECTDTTICNSIPNKFCENTLDGYYCTCKVGYTENTDKTCRADRTTVSLPVGANEHKITVKMALDLPCVADDLKLPPNYDALKSSIEAMLRAQIPSVIRVIVYNIQCGSVEFESQMIISNTDAEKSRAARDLQNIRNGGTLAVDGLNTKATAVTVNGYALSTTIGTDNTGTKVCRVYSTIVTCPTGQTCQYVGNTASCRTIQTDDDDDADDKNTLIIGLALGLGLPLVLLLIIAVVCCFWVYKIRDNKEEDDYKRDSDIPPRNIYAIDWKNAVDWKNDYRRPYYRPRNDYDNYVDKRDLYGLSTYRYF